MNMSMHGINIIICVNMAIKVSSFHYTIPDLSMSCSVLRFFPGMSAKLADMLKLPLIDGAIALQCLQHIDRQTLGQQSFDQKDARLA